MEKEMLSKNFSVEEMRCKCGCEKGKYPKTGVVILLELIRQHFGTYYSTQCKIVVTGGNRCLEHNEEIQKKYYPENHNQKEYIPYSSKSTHMEYIAVDYKVFIRVGMREEDGETNYEWQQIHPNIVHNFLDTLFPNSLGLGVYKTFNHADIRPNKRRWNNA